MAHAKLVSSFKFDTEFPRDRLQCTLNFNATFSGTPGTDWDDLCSDLATIWDTHWFVSPNPEIQVKAYDNEGTVPVFPMGSHTKNPGAAPASSGCPREVAICLSYYSERNLPRQRGRTYLPMGHRAIDLQLRPSSVLQDNVLDLAEQLAGLGGLDIDWEVWSPTDGAGRSVSHAWCDDEWDTQRRRGLRPTTRMTRAVGP